VFAIGAVVVRNVLKQPATVENVAQRSQVQQPVQSADQAPAIVKDDKKPEPVVASVPPVTIRKNQPVQADYKKRPLSSFAMSSTRASVLNATEPAGVSAAFPIDTSAQSITVSLEDGRGNAKTISVPTVSFGSQRIVQSGNQFAPKRDW